MGSRLFSDRVEPNSKPAVLVCDDNIEELEKARGLLMAEGYEVVTVLAFPKDELLNADKTELIDKPNWLSGYARDFDTLVGAIKDPAWALLNPDLPRSVVMVLSDGMMGGGKALFKGSERAKMGTTLAKILQEEGLYVPMAIFTREPTPGRMIMEQELSGLGIQVDVVAKGGVAKAALELSEKMIEQGKSRAVLPGDSADSVDHLGLLDEAPSRGIGA